MINFVYDPSHFANTVNLSIFLSFHLSNAHLCVGYQLSINTIQTLFPNLKGKIQQYPPWGSIPRNVEVKGGADLDLYASLLIQTVH